MGANLHWTRANRTQVQSRNHTTQWLLALIFLLISLFFNSQARAEQLGCSEAQLLLQLSQLSQAEEGSESIVTLKQELCGNSQAADSSVKYSNGQIATYWLGSSEAEWFYPNGKLAFKAFKKGSTLYYPNGKIATEWSHAKGVPWYHANGKILSRAAGVAGAQVFAPNGDPIKLVEGFAGAPEKSSEFSMLDFIRQVRLNLLMSSFQASL